MTETHLKIKALFQEYVAENEKFKEGFKVLKPLKSKEGINGCKKLAKVRRGEIQDAKNNA